MALNQERAEEERRGIVRWLRPDFQAKASGLEQQSLSVESSETDDVPRSSGVTARPAAGATSWPKKLADRIVAIRELMAGGALHSVASAAAQFKGAPKDEVEEILQSLAALGHLIALDKDGEAVWAAPEAARQAA